MHIRKTLALILLLTLCLSLAAPLAFAADWEGELYKLFSMNATGTVSPEDDVLLSVPYLDDGNRAHLLDLFGAQSAAEPMPVIFEVHGGAYIGGTSSINTDHARFYAENGYIVIAPNYTYLPDGTFKTAIQDLFAAYHWAVEHAEEYHLDLSRVGISGDSAGGYYVLLTAAIMTQPELQEYFEVTKPAFDFSAYVTTCPATDPLALRELLGDPGLGGYIAGHIGEKILNDDDLMRHCDLYTVVDPETYPEIYMLTTPGDLITGKETLKFDAFLTEHGLAHTLVSYKDEGSGLMHDFNIIQMAFPESRKANADIVAYLDGILK